MTRPIEQERADPNMQAELERLRTRYDSMAPMHSTLEYDMMSLLERMWAELELHRMDYQACTGAGWESPGELLSAWTTLEKEREWRPIESAAGTEAVTDIDASRRGDV